MRNNIFQTPFIEAVHYHLNLNEMPSVELGVRLGLTTDEFTELMSGERKLTHSDAKALGMIFRTAPSYWMNLDAVTYRRNEKVFQMNQA